MARTILIVDDNADLREPVTILLEEEGYNVIQAENGIEALEQYQKHRPDLILLDITMPKKDGYAVCEEIRKEDKTTPIIFLTSKTNEIYELRGLLLGADDYIRKTAPDSVLLTRVNLVFERLERIRSGKEPGLPAKEFTFGSWRVYPADYYMVSKAKKRVEISLRDVMLMRCFNEHRGEMLSKDFLISRACGANAVVEESSISTSISRLRKKLDRDADLIKPVYGGGYVFDDRRK